MRGKGVLAAFLLGVSLCFVPALGYGEIKRWKETDISFYMDKYSEDPTRGLNEWREAWDEVGRLELSLLSARIDYMMRNPTIFENVRFWYDPDGRYKKEFPEGVETEGKILVWILDNREIYRTMSGVALLDLFKRQLETIYTFLLVSVKDYLGTDIVIHTDIVAKFHSREEIPLGYFYQGEYHLWEK